MWPQRVYEQVVRPIALYNTLIKKDKHMELQDLIKFCNAEPYQ